MVKSLIVPLFKKAHLHSAFPGKERVEKYRRIDGKKWVYKKKKSEYE